MRLLSSCARKIVSTSPRATRTPARIRVQFLAFERQHVCQKGFNAIIHRICPDVVPELSGDLTVGRATADYPAMGFNKRKMEDWRRAAAEIRAFPPTRDRGTESVAMSEPSDRLG